MRRALLMLLLMTTVLTACKKDNQVNPTNDKSLILGTWRIVSTKIVNYSNGIKTDSSTFLSNYPVLVTFNSDGSGISTNDGDTIKFTYSINNNVVLFNLYASTGEEAQSQTIKILNKTQMELFRDSRTTAIEFTSDDVYTKQ